MADAYARPVAERGTVCDEPKELSYNPYGVQ
jgi:hypothetical protein